MGGGYISCGEFVGADKSGSALSGVWSVIENVYAEAALKHRLAEWDVEAQEAFRAGSMEADLPSQIAADLIKPLERYVADLGQKLGHPEHADAPALDEAAGIPRMDAKWGAGDGWRYYCAVDLLAACRVSAETGDVVVIAFD
jgi:hypothetical protein